ncbi:hypothetical protein KI387_005353, partial [Taxus chinensis]
DSFDAPVFENWRDLLDLKNPNTYLRLISTITYASLLMGRKYLCTFWQRRQDITGSEREDVPVT